MLNVQLYIVANTIDIENAIGKILKYGLIFIAVMAGLFIVGKIYKFVSHFSAEIRMEKHGTQRVEITNVNYVTKDDTFERAGFGYMIAGERGWLLGAMTGEQWEEIRSVTFKIFYKNGKEQKVICSPKDSLFQKLIKIADD